jgi:stringent starvation protein B
MDKKPVLQARSSKATSHSAHEETHAHTPAHKSEHAHAKHDSKAEMDAMAKFADYAKQHNTVPTPARQPLNVEPLRFSEMEPESRAWRSNVVRVFVFLVVVIALGVGLILLIEKVTGAPGTSAASSSSSTNSVATIPGYVIATTVLSDDEAGLVARAADFTTQQLNLGSAANNVANTTVKEITYTAYRGLSRLSWQLTNPTAGFPATTVAYSADVQLITVVFKGIKLDSADMERAVSVEVGNVQAITAAETDDGVTFTIQLADDAKYNASLNAVQGKLTLDIKTTAQLTSTSSASSSVTSTSATSTTQTTTASSTSSVASSTSSTTTSQPTGQNLENAFSRNAQQVRSGLETGVYMRNYYFQDFGPYFQFSWGFKDAGVSSVPRIVDAKLINVENKNYVEVTIEGVVEDLFQAQSWSKADFSRINLQYSNVTNVHYKGREGQTSKYWVELRRVADFRIFATNTRGTQRLLTIEVKD